MYRQSSVKTPPMKNTSSNNTLHIFHPFFALPIIWLAELEPSMYPCTKRNARPNNNQLITYYLPVCYLLRIPQ